MLGAINAKGADMSAESIGRIDVAVGSLEPLLPALRPRRIGGRTRRSRDAFST